MPVMPIDIAAMASAGFSAIALILAAIINGRTRQTSHRLGQTNHGSGSLGESVDAIRDDTDAIKTNIDSLARQIQTTSRHFTSLMKRFDDNQRFERRAIQTLANRIDILEASRPVATMRQDCPTVHGLDSKCASLCLVTTLNESWHDPLPSPESSPASTKNTKQTISATRTDNDLDMTPTRSPHPPLVQRYAAKRSMSETVSTNH